MKHKINIYYRTSLLFSESFHDLDDAKKAISNRIKNFPISLTSLIKKGNIDLQLEDFSFEYEELRLARLEALKTRRNNKSYGFWVHNFMRYCPNFKVKQSQKLVYGFHEDYQVFEDYIGTKVRNKKYGYTYAFQLIPKLK
jgi:hypothetical protein